METLWFYEYKTLFSLRTTMTKNKIQPFPIYKVLVAHQEKEEVSCKFDECFNTDRSSWVKTQTGLKGLGIFKSTKMDTGRITVIISIVEEELYSFFLSSAYSLL